MINNILSRLTTDSITYLDTAKVKVLDTAKTMAANKTPKTPSPQDFINKLKSVEVSSAEDLSKVTSIYDKTINNIDVVLNTTRGTLNELQSIQDRLTSIESTFNKLDELVGVITPVINTLRNLIPILDNLLAAQNPATGINGASLKKSFDLIDSGKEKVKKGLDAVASIPDFSEYFLSEVRPLTVPLSKGISILNTSINAIELLKSLIERLYKEFLQTISFPEAEQIAEDSGVSWEDYVDENFEEIINNESPSLTTIFKEYYSNGIRVGFEVTKEEIN